MLRVLSTLCTLNRSYTMPMQVFEIVVNESRVWNVNHHSVTTTLCTYHTMTHHTMTQPPHSAPTTQRPTTQWPNPHIVYPLHNDPTTTQCTHHTLTQLPHSAPTTQRPNYHIVHPPPTNDPAHIAPLHSIPTPANLPSSFIQRKFLKLTRLYLYVTYRLTGFRFTHFGLQTKRT